MDAGIAGPVFQRSGRMCGSRKSVFEKTVGCEFKAHLEAIKNAATLLIVYDPDDPQCKREAAIVLVTEEWGKQVLAIDPKTIRLF